MPVSYAASKHEIQVQNGYQRGRKVPTNAIHGKSTCPSPPSMYPQVQPRPCQNFGQNQKFEEKKTN